MKAIEAKIVVLGSQGTHNYFLIGKRSGPIYESLSQAAEIGGTMIKFVLANEDRNAVRGLINKANW